MAMELQEEKVYIPSTFEDLDLRDITNFERLPGIPLFEHCTAESKISQKIYPFEGKSYMLSRAMQ
jgi:hypothetical protein